MPQDQATIVVAADFATTADQLCATASDLATRLDARLVLLHVLPLGTLAPDTALHPTHGEATTALDLLTDEARQHLEPRIAALRERGIPTDLCLRTGAVPDAIAACAAETGALMVIVGSDLPSGLSLVFRSSVTEEVLLAGPCPVLVVPTGAFAVPRWTPARRQLQAEADGVILLLVLACTGTPAAPASDGSAGGGSTDGGSTGGTPTDSGAVTDTGPTAVFDPDGDGFLRTPWPTDLRTDADRHPDLSDFPNPAEIPLVDTYLARASEGQGFGTNTPIYVNFDAGIDTTLLPDPADSLDTSATLQLVVVDADSDTFGEHVPLQWQWSPDTTTYLPAHTLSVAPLFGVPLRPATTYALVITAAVAAPSAEFTEALGTDDFAATQSWLDHTGIDPAHIAVASQFTTTDPLAALVAATAWVRNQPPLGLDQVLAVEEHDWERFDLHVGSYLGPLFQEGERPYREKGGGLVFDDDPDAEPVAWETMRLSLSTPKDLSAPPAEGWPVTVVLHGTGGDYLSGCCQRDSDVEHAAAMAAVGGLTLGIDLPLHGSRGGDLTDDLTYIEHPYNVRNPDSAVSVQRQSAIDLIYLARGLAQGPTFTLQDGTPVPIDPDRITVLGHSQGGLSLALAAPFFGDDVQAIVLSGTGAGVAITLLERTDPIPLDEVLAGVLQLGEDETLTELHPVAGLVQWLSDVTDPINTAPWWWARGGLWEGQAPMHVLHFSGLLDEQSTWRTAEALAAAGGTPPVAPAATWAESWELLGFEEQALPAQGNAVAFDGSTTTALFSQWAEEGHGVLYDNAVARRQYQGFLETVGTAAPILPASTH